MDLSYMVLEGFGNIPFWSLTSDLAEWYCFDSLRSRGIIAKELCFFVEDGFEVVWDTLEVSHLKRLFFSKNYNGMSQALSDLKQERPCLCRELRRNDVFDFLLV